MQEQALKVASHITHPVTIAAFALVVSGTAFRLAVRAKKPHLAWVLAAGILVLGLAPLASFTFLQSKGVYRVRVVVLGPNQSPFDDAHVNSSSGGEPKRVGGGWEFDIPPQTRPADGKLTLFASASNTFLTGASTLVLAQDYYPTVTIQLAADTSAMVRGIVVDEHRRSVANAHVSIPGSTNLCVTDEMGNFVLPAHAADGQVVQVRAQKGQLVGSVLVPAGKMPVEILIRRP